MERPTDDPQAELKQELQQLISRDKMDQVWKRLESLPAADLGGVAEDVPLLRREWQTVQKAKRRNLMSFSESSREEAKIISRLVEAIGEIGEAGSPQDAPTEETPEVIKILFLAANPEDSGRLRLGQEHRDIEESLRRAKHRDRYQMEERFAVRSRDLARAMLDEDPMIVHFSGHGLEISEATEAPGSRSLDLSSLEEEQLTGGIALEDSDGNTKVVRASALGDLFRLSKGRIQCVVLNACHSQRQANELIKHVPYVIGMNTAVPDKTAIAFAVGFYDALGAGRSIPDAFDFAKVTLSLEDLPGADIPEILTQEA
jgi:hypothetical protein